jgi:hypothetical protein
VFCSCLNFTVVGEKEITPAAGTKTSFVIVISAVVLESLL